MKNNKLAILLRGIITENPVLILVLGTCPTLATTGSIISALSMGLAATVVLICSNAVISALRKIIPDSVRVPCYIVIIASFVTAVQMLLDILQKEVPEKYFYNCEFDFLGYDKVVCANLHISGHDILKRVNSPYAKCQTLTTCGGGNTQKKVMDNGRPRKLTPLEYERLQTLPDGYTEGVADSHRYTAVGNGWTVDVIAHILRGLKKEEVHNG